MIMDKFSQVNDIMKYIENPLNMWYQFLALIGLKYFGKIIMSS